MNISDEETVAALSPVAFDDEVEETPESETVG